MRWWLLRGPSVHAMVFGHGAMVFGHGVHGLWILRRRSLTADGKLSVFQDWY